MVPSRLDPKLPIKSQPGGQEEREQLPRTGRTDSHEGVDREKAWNSQFASPDGPVITP